MAQLKANEVERFIENPDPSVTAVLVYGVDNGLVSERASRIAQASTIDRKDPFASARLEADEVAADPLSLLDEANTINMFGGRRLIRISGTTRRNLAAAIKPLLETPPDQAMLLVEAGDLKRDAALRKLFEGARSTVIIPCYRDNDAALDRLIDEELVQHGLAVDRDIKALLRSMLGDDRLASRGELAKLALYCGDTDHVSEDDIKAVMGDASALVLDEIIDAAALGNLQPIDRTLRRMIDAGTAPDTIIRMALGHFQQLQKIRVQFDDGDNAQSLVARLRPPVHFSRRDRVIRAVRIWRGDRLAKAAVRLQQTMLDCRKSPTLGPILVMTTLFAIALEAKRQGG